MAKAKPYPPQNELCRIFKCDEDGNLFWKEPFSKHLVGSKVSIQKTEKGYCRIYLKRRPLFLHRVLWKMWYGADPVEIDHINGVRDDNRKVNLRNATRSQNNRSTRPRGGASRFKGVYRAKCGNKWGSRIKVRGFTKHLGTYSNEREAATAYDNAAKELHKDFAVTNKDLGLY